MLKAVALKKANVSRLFDHARTPREDLITSAVFGPLELLATSDQLCALEAMFGTEILKLAERAPEVTNVSFRFWKRMFWKRMPSPGRIRYVEPDLIVDLADDNRAVFRLLIEAKWGAKLGENQLLAQWDALGGAIPTLVILLGSDAKHGEDAQSQIKAIKGHDNFRGFMPIAWREVAENLTRAESGMQSSPARTWVRQVRGFLARTPFGQVFTGFDHLTLDHVPRLSSFGLPGRRLSLWTDAAKPVAPLPHAAFWAS